MNKKISNYFVNSWRYIQEILYIVQYTNEPYRAKIIEEIQDFNNVFCVKDYTGCSFKNLPSKLSPKRCRITRSEMF